MPSDSLAFEDDLEGAEFVASGDFDRGTENVIHGGGGRFSRMTAVVK